MIELAGDVIFMTDADGRFTFVNGRVQTLLDYSPDEVIGHHFLNFVAPHWRRVVEEFYKRQFREHILESTLEFEVQTKAGDMKWVEQVAILKIRENQIVGFQATVRDICSRKQMEAELANERDLLITLIDTIPDFIYVKDANRRIVLNNKAHAEYIGAKTREKSIGKTDAEFYPEEIANKIEVDDRRVLEEGVSIINVEEQISDSDWVLTSKIPLRDENGNIHRLMGISRKITEYKRLQAELSKHLEQVTIVQGINRELTKTLNLKHVLQLTMDIVLRLTGADTGFVALTDDTGEMRIVESTGHYSHETSLPYTNTPDELVSRAIREKQPAFVMDLSKEDAYYSLQKGTCAQLAVPLLSQDKVLGVICLETQHPGYFSAETVALLHLVTDPVMIAIENARLHAMLEERLEEISNLYVEVSRLEQLKSDMIRIAAHDLRNPLQIIFSYLGILRMTIANQLDTKNKGRFEQLHVAAKRMEHIIDNILSLQRIEESVTGNLDEVIDLVGLTHRVFEEYHHQAADKKQIFTFNPAEAVLNVKADTAQLREAIANLIGNAIKYTPEGGEVHVRLEKLDGTARFEVEDSGYGIPEEMQQNLFKAFYRAQSEETIGIEGTGLGLYLVKNIIERHNGELFFHSTYGEGSIFGFVFPLAEPPIEKARIQ